MNIPALLPEGSSPLSTLAWLTGLRRVGENTAVTVRRFGRFHRSLGPGWHWTLPGLERIGSPVSLIGHHLDVAGGGRRAELYYQILDPARAGAELDRVDAYVASAAAAVLEALPAGAEAETLKDRLNARLAGAGLRVIRCRPHAA